MSRPDPFAPIDRATNEPAAAKRKTWAIVLPVPADAPAPPSVHFKLGKSSAWWTYTDAAGARLGYVLRFDAAGGEKQFRPLTLWRPTKGGKTEWRWEILAAETPAVRAAETR